MNRVYVTLEEDSDICRICYEPETSSQNKLISPCRCAGHLKYIHQECLQTWRNSNLENSYPRTNCMQCNYKYQFETRETNGRYIRIINYICDNFAISITIIYLVLFVISHKYICDKYNYLVFRDLDNSCLMTLNLLFSLIPYLFEFLVLSIVKLDIKVILVIRSTFIVIIMHVLCWLVIYLNITILVVYLLQLLYIISRIVYFQNMADYLESCNESSEVILNYDPDMDAEC